MSRTDAKMAIQPHLTLRQFDATSDQPTKTYILSSTTNANNATICRLDEIPSASNTTTQQHTSRSASSQTHSSLLPPLLTVHLTNLLAYLKLLFLPTGYPNSVTPDYTPYQIYDSIQAFASTIASLLSSRAVLQSLNVISTSPSSSSEKSDGGTNTLPASSTEAATAATLLSILQSTLSNLTTILFASHAAPRISPDVKFYRFLADVVNDAAFVLDLLAPSLPGSFGDVLTTWSGLSLPRLSLPIRLPLTITPRVVALCTSSMLRATCGVAGGSSKAVLSAHFARSNPEQVGDLNAKDGSQETIINLLGMWVGGVVVSRVEDVSATWCWMLTLLGIHLWANYRAVRSVRLRGLNRERAGIVIGEVVRGEEGWKERIEFAAVGGREGVLGVIGIVRRWLGGTVGQEWRDWKVGVSVEDFVRSVCNSDEPVMGRSGVLTVKSATERLPVLLREFGKEQYVPWVNIRSGRITISLKKGASPRSQLKGCLHASMVQSQIHTSAKAGTVDVITSFTESRRLVNERWDELCKIFERAGWDLDSINLENGLGSRVEIGD